MLDNLYAIALKMYDKVILPKLPAHNLHCTRPCKCICRLHCMQCTSGFLTRAPLTHSPKRRLILKSNKKIKANVFCLDHCRCVLKTPVSERALFDFKTRIFADLRGKSSRASELCEFCGLVNIGPANLPKYVSDISCNNIRSI